MRKRSLWIALSLMACLGPGAALAQPADRAWRTTATPAEQALDATAFQGAGEVLAQQLTDVESAVVVLRGRVVFSYYRDGDAERLRDTQ